MRKSNETKTKTSKLIKSVNPDYARRKKRLINKVICVLKKETRTYKKFKTPKRR